MNFKIRYHGNHCGPYWSDGKYQPSVCGYAPAIDQFDQTCKEHDCAYATHGPHWEADHRFFRANIGKGLKRSVAAIAVLAQGNQMKRKFIDTGDTFRDKLYSRYNHRKNIRNQQVVNQMRIDSDKAVARIMNMQDVEMQEATFVSKNISSMGGKMIESTLGGKFSDTPIADESLNNIARTPSGVTESAEYIGTVSGAEIAWFGHSNFDYVKMTYHSVQALAKYMMYKLGYTISSWEDPLPQGFTGVQMTIAYQNSATAASTTFLSDTIGSAERYTNVANRLRDMFVTIYSATADPYVEYLYILKINGTTEVPLGSIRLAGMVISYFSESKLAVQNITPAPPTSDEPQNSESILVAALTGRVFQFNGNHARKISPTRSPLDLTATTYVTTVPALSQPTNVDPYSEPVIKSNFYGCKKVREVFMNPGQIKTNQFSATASTTYNKLWRNYATKNQANYNHNYGYFHLFGIERKVSITGNPEIQLALNCDIRLGTIVEERNAYVATAVTSHNAITT